MSKEQKEQTRIEKLLRASEIVRAMDEREAEIARLVAMAMQTGYDIRRMGEEKQPA